MGPKTQGLTGNFESLIAIALLDYEHQFMRNLQAMDNR